MLRSAPGGPETEFAPSPGIVAEEIAGPPSVGWQRWAITPIALITFGSGVLTLLALLHHQHLRRESLLQDIFPIEFFRLSRFLIVPAGFALILTSFNIMKRKRNALRIVLVLSVLAGLGHIVQGHHILVSLLCFSLAGLLVATRKAFTVRSGPLDFESAAFRIALTAVMAALYGVAGFWLLDKRHFGINFDVFDSMRSTWRFLLFLGDPAITARTHYARWFIDSLYLVSAMTIGYTLLSVFRPVVYRYRTYPLERRIAEEITKRHGRSSLDFFKYWHDKSFFFSRSGRSFLAYRVGGRHAIVLGDPVGPEEEMAEIAGGFAALCRDNDWGLAFHQVLPDFLEVYHALHFRRLKIGDDAIVNVQAFTLEGKGGREFRGTINRMERDGFHFEAHEPPLSDDVLARCREVSDEWLEIPGRRERGFTLGAFEDNYVRQTPVCLAVDGEGRVDGFLNLIPSFHPGEATIDLMRRRARSHNGIMDYLFIKLLLHLKERGYERFDLGMAPMAGFQEHEDATPEERAVHTFFRHLNFLFSFEGLRAYKAKFASSWEPRYLIYQNVLQLPAVAIALGRVTETRAGRKRART